jgi:predicted 3-demethylubiquinone-9 3-methyltransferase (glyoxalase superfamily)
MANLFPCLWFDGNAEEAAGFYVTLLPGSHVDKVWRSPAQTPSGLALAGSDAVRAGGHGADG